MPSSLNLLISLTDIVDPDALENVPMTSLFGNRRNGEPNLKTAQTSQEGSFPSRNYSKPLAGLFLVLLFSASVWQSPLPTAYAQTSSSFRFTESLKPLPGWNTESYYFSPWMDDSQA